MKRFLLKPSLSISSLLIFSSPAHAAVDLGDIPQTPWRGGAATLFPNLGVLISILLHNAYILAGVLLLVIVFIGGFMFIGSGGDDPKKAQMGKDAATWAAVGFLIIFSSYWILQIVKVIIGVDIINPGL